jgi:hypothetical protein
MREKLAGIPKTLFVAMFWMSCPWSLAGYVSVCVEVDLPNLLTLALLS